MSANRPARSSTSRGRSSAPGPGHATAGQAGRVQRRDEVAVHAAAHVVVGVLERGPRQVDDDARSGTTTVAAASATIGPGAACGRRAAPHPAQHDRHGLRSWSVVPRSSSPSRLPTHCRTAVAAAAALTLRTGRSPSPFDHTLSGGHCRVGCCDAPALTADHLSTSDGGRDRSHITVPTPSPRASTRGPRVVGPLSRPRRA